MTHAGFLEAVTAWRALSDVERTRRRLAVVVDEVVESMAMEGEPVSAEWEQQAREEQELLLAELVGSSG